MSRKFSKLSPRQEESLTLLAEECAEVIQCVSKIMRHGYGSCNPTIMDAPTNRTSLAREIGDVHAAITILHAEGEIGSMENIHSLARAKLSKVGKYLHYRHPGVKK